MPLDPRVHLGSRPRPGEGVRVEAVILGPTGLQVGDEIGAALPVAALQVVGTEGAQQQLGLIEPGGMGRSLKQPSLPT